MLFKNGKIISWINIKDIYELKYGIFFSELVKTCNYYEIEKTNFSLQIC